jgi:amino acid transporter
LKAQLGRAVLIRTVVAWTMTCLLLFVAIGRSMTWDLWSESNNLYWGTVYGATPPTPLPTWPDPVLFATWLVDSTAFRVVLLLGMAAWVVGFAATLFLAATRVLLAAAADRVLPSWVARTSGDSVPVGALALLVGPACGLAALDAYWGSFAGWAAAGVVALAATMAGSGVAAVRVFRRKSRGVAIVASLFVGFLLVVVGTWVLDGVYGIGSAGPLVFLAALYGLIVALYLWARARYSSSVAEEPLPEAPA